MSSQPWVIRGKIQGRGMDGLRLELPAVVDWIDVYVGYGTFACAFVGGANDTCLTSVVVRTPLHS